MKTENVVTVDTKFSFGQSLNSSVTCLNSLGSILRDNSPEKLLLVSDRKMPRPSDKI
jgi:hypothetical protein